MTHTEKKKIPCTVQIITLNCAHLLRRCLESVKDFDDILVCDGNSTDNTRDIAREYGARIISQTDTNEPNYRLKSFADIRNRCIREGKYDWNLYIDADEEMPARTVQEIREIVSQPIPDHLVYNVPNRILYEGREIRYSIPYPGYQMRLMNRRAGVWHARSPHSRLDIDPKRTSVGYLKNPWYVIIEHGKPGYDPVINRGHIQREINGTSRMPLGHFVRWIVWNKSIGIFKNIIQTALLYARHGFKETLPPSIELLRVKYKWLLLTGALAARMRTE